MPDSDKKMPDSMNEMPDDDKKVPDSMNKMPDSDKKVPDSVNEETNTDRKVQDSDNKASNTAKLQIDDEQKQQIYKYVLENGSITTNKAAEILGLKQHRARTILSNMVENNYLKKEGAARSTIYVAGK